MCGIAGGVWTGGGDQAPARVQIALDMMRHRGPDDSGCVVDKVGPRTVVLGQNRLAIIDLSSGGHQPMVSPDGLITLIFNGEIYNYKELREELRALGHVFTTQSDTEVLLTAWRVWGRNCLTRLEGMFAFGVHDRRDQTLTCARDAFGIKPFFYDWDGETLSFASELPALLAIGNKPRRPDVQRAYDYLVHGYYDNEVRTFVEGVRHLLPGHLMEMDLRSGGLSAPVSWWTAPIQATSTLSYTDAVEAVRAQFLDNVRLHLRSDVPLGAALSGGIDSSAVVCAMRHLEPDMPIHTFSYIAPGSDVSEEQWVDLVNATTGAIPHKVLATPQELARDIDTLISVQGEPFGSTSIYAQYRVFQAAREAGITVTLDGQGADELLAGYDGYPGQRLMSLLETGNLAGAHQFASNWSHWTGQPYRVAWMHLGRIALPNSLYGSARKALGRDWRPAWLDMEQLANAGVDIQEPRQILRKDNRGRRVTERLAYSLQVHGLPHLLRHGDRNAMAFSIESRVPFLTLPMAGLLLGQPEDRLISAAGESKAIFRAAMRGIVPDAILDRRDKIGFATPEQTWFKELAPTARQWLSRANDIPFLNVPVMLEQFDRVISGQAPFTWQLWRWVNYVKWYEARFVT